MIKKSGKTEGWEDIPERSTRPKRGIFINVDGEEGTGKSSLALTLAKLGQVAYADIDQSIDRAKRPDMPRGKKFSARMLPIRYTASVGGDSTKESCKLAWNTLKKGTTEAAEQWAKVVVVDAGDEAWEILRMGAFGTLTPRGRTDSLYGPVNAAFRQWIRTMHRHAMAHVVFVNKMKDVWKKGKDGQSERTGKKERVGFRELGYLADMTVRTFKEDGEFKVRIEVCKLAPHGPALEGSIFEGDEVDLAHILCTVTDTTIEDWYESNKR